MGDLGIEEMKRYKDNNWYDWRMKNWNTKWNAYGFEEPTYSGDIGTMTFLTANCSPFRVLFKLSEKYPDVEFELRYADEDLGYNVGEISFIAGELIDDNSPQEGTAAAQELAADIMGIELSFNVNSASGYRITHESEDGALATLNRIEKHISDQGFEVKRAGKEDIKRFLSRYFGHMVEDSIDDVDGERMIKKWIIPD